jgi:serine/threonine protein kinase
VTRANLSAPAKREIPPTLELSDRGREPEAPLPELGAILGEYQLTEVIGQGAMGRVYRARHLILGQDYALKVMAAHHSAPAVREERFRREAQATALVNHPNVVRVLYSGLTEGGQIYLVMELLQGQSLAAILSERPLEPVRAAWIVQQIARGLGAIHELGLVHRDIKPSNVIIEDPGGEDRVKILDLGLVGFIDPEPDVRLTQHGHLMGTPIYMAPEALGQAQYSPKTDLYSLGALFYEMLAGQPPFDGTLREVMWHHHVTAPPLLPSSHGLEEVVYQLLEKEPERRPADAQAVGQEIERRLAKTSAALVFEDTPRKVRRSLRRHLRGPTGGPDWISRGAVFALALVLTSAFGWALVGSDEPEVTALIEPPPVPAPTPLAPAPPIPVATTAARPSVPGPSTPPPAAPPIAKEQPSPRQKPRARGPSRGVRAPAEPVEVTIVSNPPGAVVETSAGRLGLTPLVVVVPGDRPTVFRLLKDGYREGRLTFAAGRSGDRLQLRLVPAGPR